jgi:hypothetical protein
MKKSRNNGGFEGNFCKILKNSKKIWKNQIENTGLAPST